MSDRPEWRDFGGDELESVRSVERGTYNRSFRDGGSVASPVALS